MNSHLKQCTKCKQWKPVDDFYGSVNGSADNLMAWCRQCMKELSASRQKSGKKREAGSTRLARIILARQGIPCVSGKSAGLRWVDLVAWGCIPIEAKAASSNKFDRQQFIWTFTPRQSHLRMVGFVLFIADLGNSGNRTFVVPASVEWLFSQDAASHRTTFSATLESDHGNADSWRLVKDYENAFYLIEEARQRFAAELAQSDLHDLQPVLDRIF